MRYTCSSAFLLMLFFVLPLRLCAQPFIPNELGHVDDPAFKTFLKANGIQLCGAFTVTHSLDSTIHFAVIFKNDQMQFLESTGKIYPTYGEYIKATGVEEWIAKGNDTNPFKRGDKAEYDDAEAPEWFQGNNTHTFEKRGKVGMVFNKKKILPAIYDDIRQDLAHGEPVFIITRDGLEGIADTNGRIVVEPAYTHISGLFSTGRICYHVEDGYQEGFMDIAGNFSIPLQPQKLSYRGRYIQTSTSGYEDRRYGIMDTMGNVVLETIYNYVDPVEDYASEGPTVYYNAIIAETEEGGKGIVDYTGKVLLEPVYYDIEQSYQNVYRFTTAFGENALCGLFDMASGKVILPAEYRIGDHYGDESDTLPISARTEDGFRHGLITNKGDIVVPVEYTYVKRLKHGQLLILGKDKRYQVTDMQLRPTHPETYEALSQLNEYGSDLPENLLLAKKGRMEGVIDVKGKVIIPFRYDRIHPDNYVLRVVEGKANDFMDLTGTILFTTDLTVLDCKIGYVYVKDENGAYILHDLYGNRLVNGKLKM